MTPSLIVCLRHGEKPANAEDDSEPDDEGPGLDAQGRENKHSLTIRGWQRAGALAGTDLCGRLAGVAVTALTIFVPDYGSKADTAEHRPYETMLPLALRLGIKPKHPCEPDDPKLADAVTAVDGLAVVCWEHDNLARLVSGLVGMTVEWPDDPSGHSRFDVLWLVRPGASVGTWGYEQADQHLLAGDEG